MRFAAVGLLSFERERAARGYTLVAPPRGRSCYLVAMNGEVAHEWRLPDRLGSLAYVLPGGRLLTTGMTSEGPPIVEGKGGRLREFDWEGRLVWECVDHGQHHDFRRLANGNTLYLGWEAMPEERARRVRGGVPGTEDIKGGRIYSDYLREVTPEGRTAWEWHAYDLEIERYPLADDCWRWEFAHANSCCPMPKGVLVSFRHLDTVMLIDRATRKVVWEKRDPLWGHQHNAELLPNGNVTLFANGMTGTGVENPARTDAIRGKVLELQCLKRLEAPEDLVGTVLFLASPASAFITGQSIAVDGGSVHLSVHL